MIATLGLAALALSNPVAIQAAGERLVYDPATTTSIAVAPGGEVEIALVPGDAAQSVTLENTAAFAVVVAASGDRMTVKPLRAPVNSRMTVVTQARRYDFALWTDLAALPVRTFLFASGSAPAVAEKVAAPAAVVGTWRIAGSRAIRPSEMWDDGERIYLRWAPNQALPAVFAIGPTGKEEVVDGYMRDDVFVVDRMHNQLVLRIDRDRVTAVRQVRK